MLSHHRVHTQNAKNVLIAFCTILFCSSYVSAEVAHPFMLWNAADIEKAKEQIRDHEWARQRVNNPPIHRDKGKTFNNLFRYLVLEDQKAGDAERKYLLSFIGAPVDKRPWSDNYLHALRYDALYHSLTEKQREDLQATFRKHIRYEIDNDKRLYTRFNWLPNMQWPRKNGAMLMAVALRDKELIKEIASANGGWFWYFDEYISDGYFYNEEFGKHYSNIGEMLLWCRGLERLGLDEWGYGYVGKGASGGATMRKYLESIHLVGYPRVDLGTNRYHYPKMAMGDAKGSRGMPSYAFQHGIVQGYLTDGDGGNVPFMGSNMNGRDHRNQIIEKMRDLMWYEIAHAKWPDANFDYFLAQMRGPDDIMYIPSLYWGIEPIDPAKVTPPKAPSGAYQQRGIAMLRFDESINYWSSPAPAVAMRFATPYVHSVPDEFAILGFYAFNRPIYINRQVSAGYAGTDPGWSNSVRSHATVFVDGQEPRTIGEIVPRFESHSAVKFVAVTGEDLYPGVEQTRALFLTGEYLFDVFALESDRPRSYTWAVHTLGHACPDSPKHWASTRHLTGTIFDIRDERSRITDKSWAVTSTQITAGAHPTMSGLGERWFDKAKRVGVRTSMLGQPGTIAYYGTSPGTGGEQERINHGEIETGGVSVAATRNAESTAFIALHEPFQNKPRIGAFEQLDRTEDAVLVRIKGLADGKSYHDYLMFRWGAKADQPVTLAHGNIAFTFTGHGYIRQFIDQEDAVSVVVGKVKAVKVKVDTKDGKPIAGSQPQAVSARWSTDVARLPMAGKATVDLTLRSLLPVAESEKARQIQIGFKLPEGISVTPEQISFDPAAGNEQIFTIAVAANEDSKPLLSMIRPYTIEQSIQIQPSPLQIAHGMQTQREQRWPRSFIQTVHSPRYIMKFNYLKTAATSLMRDPDGLRRNSGGQYRPIVLLPGEDQRGKTQWMPQRVGDFRAFQPRPRQEKDGERFLADMGEHPHGARSAFIWRFYEDWVVVQLKENDPPAQVVFDWSPDRKFKRPGVSNTLAEKQKPALKLWATSEGITKNMPKDDQEIIAFFERPTGFDYGQATFYPPGSKIVSRGMIAHPGNEAMAFTFCLEDEFESLIKKWQDRSEQVYVKPWGQGDMGQ